MKKVAIDGRMLRYDHAGIGRYIWNLQAAIAQEQEAPVDVQMLVDRRDRLNKEPALPIRRVIAPIRSGVEGVLLSPGIRAMDVVHFPDHGVPAGVKKPSVVTVHDVSFLSHPETHSLQSRQHYVQAIKSLRRAEQVIAVSAHVRTLLLDRRLADSERITVVPEAAGIRHDLPDREQLWPTPYAITIGTIQPRKNIEIASRAFGESRFSSYGTLLVVGAIGYKGANIVRSVRASRNSDRVRFVGCVSDTVLHSLLSNAEFLLAASLDEGFGLPALEAMSLGVPVVASMAGALPELVSDAGLFVDPVEPESIKVAIDKVAEDAQLRGELRKRGLIRASSYTWSRTAQETMAVYEMAA
tara:strand:+ start:317 stop:1381 length:1065 start_codon:yes stop_codon:yes gene_type:complete